MGRLERKGGEREREKLETGEKKVAGCHANGQCSKINSVNALRALLRHPPAHKPAQCYHVCVNVLGWTLLFWGAHTLTGPSEEMFDTPQTIQQEVQSSICVSV